MTEFEKIRWSNLKQRLLSIGALDAEEAYRKDVEYKSSWKRRGGVGAFMMLARKWDRLEARLESEPEDIKDPAQYDIFGHIAADNRPEGLIDDIRDLRRYLMHVEAEMMAGGVIKPDVLPQPPAPCAATAVRTESKPTDDGR